MTMAERVPMLDREQASCGRCRCGLPEELADLSVFRVALHQPRVAVTLYGLLDALLFRGSLDARLRESWSSAHRLDHWLQIRMDSTLANRHTARRA